LDIAKDGKFIKLFHLSFRKFPRRCTNFLFGINEKKAYSFLAGRCQNILSCALKRNICDVKERGALAREAEGFYNHLPGYVCYACRYWVAHHQQSGAELHNNKQAQKFFKRIFFTGLRLSTFLGRCASV
jgi:hypothetical protein